jgi:RNA-directed DNA polymerase
VQQILSVKVRIDSQNIGLLTISPLLGVLSSIGPLQDAIDELRRYIAGWLNYFGVSHAYPAILELDERVRRRERLYYWKQWKQPRTRRRHLLALGIPLEEVHMATRCRKGHWRMSSNSIGQRALTNRWLNEQGVPNMCTSWIVLHYGAKARV